MDDTVFKTWGMLAAELAEVSSNSLARSDESPLFEERFTCAVDHTTSATIYQSHVKIIFMEEFHHRLLHPTMAMPRPFKRNFTT